MFVMIRLIRDQSVQGNISMYCPKANCGTLKVFDVLVDDLLEHRFMECTVVKQPDA